MNQEDQNNEDNVRVQKKLYFLVDKLKEFHSKLDDEIQNRIPLEHLVQIANCLVLDEHIFEVVGKLREYQNTAEEMYKKERDQQVMQHQKEIENYVQTLSDAEISHTVALAKKQHEKKLQEIDKAIVQNLDQLVREQQQTLSMLGIPGFFETFDNKSITVQMHLLSFILRLERLLVNKSSFN